MHEKSIKRFNSLIGNPTKKGCINWRGALTPKGYGSFYMNGGTRRAHRVAYELYKGEIPKGMHVCHSCDNRKCVNPDHLWVGTAKENSEDMARKNRQKRSHAKLTIKDVRKIRKLLDQGHLVYRIAKNYPVSVYTIYQIKDRKIWRYV